MAPTRPACLRRQRLGSPVLQLQLQLLNPCRQPHARQHLQAGIAAEAQLAQRRQRVQAGRHNQAALHRGEAQRSQAGQRRQSRGPGAADSQLPAPAVQHGQGLKLPSGSARGDAAGQKPRDPLLPLLHPLLLLGLVGVQLEAAPVPPVPPQPRQQRLQPLASGLAAHRAAAQLGRMRTFMPAPADERGAAAARRGGGGRGQGLRQQCSGCTRRKATQHALQFCRRPAASTALTGQRAPKVPGLHDQGIEKVGDARASHGCGKAKGQWSSSGSGVQPWLREVAEGQWSSSGSGGRRRPKEGTRNTLGAACHLLAHQRSFVGDYEQGRVGFAACTI